MYLGEIVCQRDENIVNSVQKQKQKKAKSRFDFEFNRKKNKKENGQKLQPNKEKTGYLRHFFLINKSKTPAVNFIFYSTY